jgi:SAM-dependent methyltransferase
MFQHIPSVKGKRVLEVGCADGLACDLLLFEEPQQIIGIDVMDMVGCAYKDPRIRYQRVDGSVLPFDDNSFHVSYSIATLEHCFDPFKVIEEMKRVTRPGGYCYIQAGPLYFSPFGHHMFGYFDDKPWVHLRLSPEEMIEELIANGRGEKIERDLGKSVENYVQSMMSIDHINGRKIDEYRLGYFEKRDDIELISSTRSYEGEDLLTNDIQRDLGYLSRKDLLAHGFELIFRKKH